jgi:hypothetical protein
MAGVEPRLPPAVSPHPDLRAKRGWTSLLLCQSLARAVGRPGNEARLGAGSRDPGRAGA